MASEKIILDTNLWISFLIGNSFKKLDNLIFEKQIQIIFSQELLEEFLSVTKRPKFRKYFSSDQVENLLETLDEIADFVEVKTKIEICRDLKDNFLLSLAKDSSADFLITGDRDLLDIQKIENTQIITLATFLERFP